MPNEQPPDAVTFMPCSEDRYHEMLDILPPVTMSSRGYLIGEPWSHRDCQVTGEYRPTYKAMVCRRNAEGKRYFESTSGVTVAEWRHVNPETITVATHV